MQNLNEKYQNALEQKENVLKEIQEMQEQEAVKKYMELQKQKNSLVEQCNDLYRKIKMEEYESCQHILIKDPVEVGRVGRYFGQPYFGCIKCGLTSKVLDLNLSREKLNSYPQIHAMYDYLNKNHAMLNHLKGIKTNIDCDIDLARAIYARIKNAHPTIDDETAIKYLKIALNDIRNINVSNERKISRARRLSLNDDFNRWNARKI